MQVLDMIPLSLDAAEVIRQVHLSEAGEKIAAQMRELVAVAQEMARPYPTLASILIINTLWARSPT